MSIRANQLVRHSGIAFPPQRNCPVAAGEVGVWVNEYHRPLLRRRDGSDADLQAAVYTNLNTYVDAATGSDTNAGTSDEPLATITEAIARQPVAWKKDNLIWVRPGSYDVDPLSSLFDAGFGSFSGDSGSPLAIIAEEPEVLLSSTAVSSATAYTVTVTGAGWVADAYKGATFEILTGTGSTAPSQRATVRSNTTDTLYLQRELTTAPDATTTFRLIAASSATELVASGAAAVFPFSPGGIGMRDMQIRMSGGGAFGFSDGCRVLAMSGCKIDLGSRNFNIRRGASLIFGTSFGGQWDNSDQGIPLFPAGWDCSTHVTGSGANNNVNLDESSSILGGMLATGLKINPGRNSSFRPTSLFAKNTTLTAVEGAIVNFQGTTNVPTVLDGQKSSSASLGIVNLSRAQLSLGAATEIKNSGGHGVLADQMSYVDLTAAVLSGSSNTGVGVKLDRGAQLDGTTAKIPTIAGTAGELKVGDTAAQAWSTMSPATSVIDTTGTLCRATTR